MSQHTGVLPRGWQREFLERADFSHSFSGLKDCTHFFADAMRGRIRSYQLRHQEAAQYFEVAERLSLEAEDNIPCLVRRLLLGIYQFEDALMQEAVEVEREIETEEIPELSQSVKKQYPEVEYVIGVRAHAQALLNLHVGNLQASLLEFKRLIAAEKKAISIENGFRYLGLAAAQHALGLREEAQKSLENAGLVFRTSGQILNKALAAAVLSAFYRFLGKRELASEWVEFLRNLDCPSETKRVFVVRAERILVRCLEVGRLLVM